MTRQKRSLLIFFALALSILACGGVGQATQAPPPTATPASPESADTLEEQWQQALQSAREDGGFTLTITEGQMTTFLAEKVAEQPEAAISDPQVFLRDGQMQILGKVANGGISATMELVLEVGLSGEGLPQFEVVSAEIGPFPVPDEVLNELSRSINEGITGQGLDSADIQIESIEIADGFMTITGRKQ